MKKVLRATLLIIIFTFNKAESLSNVFYEDFLSSAIFFEIDNQINLVESNDVIAYDTFQNKLSKPYISDTNGNITFIKNILENDLRDCSIYICSDSTGNEKIEWVYRFVNEFLKVKYPHYSINYHLYSYTNGKYNNLLLQKGTGKNTLHIYNSALSGGTPQSFLGEKKQTSIVDHAPYDLFILNHGHNLINSYTHSDDYRETRALFLEATEEVLKFSPNCGVLVYAQNPRRDDTEMDSNYEKVQNLCALRGFGMIDVFSQYMKLNKDSSLYNDNIHPSSEGTNLYLQELYKKWNGSSSSIIKHTSLFDELAPVNLLNNGVFLNYNSGLPVNWKGTSVVTKETSFVEFDSFNNYSIKLDGGSIYQDLSAGLRRRLDGKVVTLAVRMFIPKGETKQVGRVAISSSDFFVSSPPTTSGQGGWRWKIITKKLSIKNYCRIQFYGSKSGDGSCYIDRAILVEGELPKDFLISQNISLTPSK